MSYAIKQSFSKSKKFGDKLEKDFALRVIKQMHPGCTIKSPDDAGIFREDGNAIPDHCVMKGKKPITFYDSKRKNKLYSKRWSTDEKLLQYREIAKKYGVPCYLIFYCENHDKKNVYIVDVMVEPKFHKEVNNQYGKTMYGYHLSQTTAYPIKGKHSVNIRKEDRDKVKYARSVEEKKTELLKIIERCTPEQSFRPMHKTKINYWRSQINYKLHTPYQLDSALYNIVLDGEGMGMGNRNYKKRIEYA